MSVKPKKLSPKDLEYTFEELRRHPKKYARYIYLERQIRGHVKYLEHTVAKLQKAENVRLDIKWLAEHFVDIMNAPCPQEQEVTEYLLERNTKLRWLRDTIVQTLEEKEP